MQQAVTMVACALHKVTSQFIEARIDDLVRSRTNEKRYNWIQNIGIATVVREDNNDNYHYIGVRI